jgi:gamma-glutamyltranspeptidase
MIHTKHGRSGVISAPHHLAAGAGANILRAGGNVVEAMVAAAATIAVVYPHMNSIGGDGFWIISEPGKEPIGIDACGPAAGLSTRDAYKEAGCATIPARGPLAALTVAGTVGGWVSALEAARGWGNPMPLSEILADAVAHARAGVSVTLGQEKLTREKLEEVKHIPGFAQTYLTPEGDVLHEGAVLKQAALAVTLDRLGQAGLDDFYRGDVARSLADGLENAGSFVRLNDFESYSPLHVSPLSVSLGCGKIFNMPPPTQGVSALMILALFERLGVKNGECFDHVHGLVEATKKAFILRDAYVTDPADMSVDANSWLRSDFLDARAKDIDMVRALPWPHESKQGDTIWMGAADQCGRVVSFNQSTYWEYGSAVVIPETGVVWQNRGTSFSLDPANHNVLAPGKRPFHTLIPALAHLEDGRVMAYGNMGGEGQPQSQAAVFTRHVMFGTPMQEAISAPRWLLGRTWGDETTSLKLESRFDSALVEKLMTAGHNVEMMDPFTSTMGHAGAVSVSLSGGFEGACDPRSDGAAVAL